MADNRRHTLPGYATRAVRSALPLLWAGNLCAQPIPMKFPDPWDTSHYWPLYLLLSLFALAILIEVLRRVRQRGEQLRAEWRTVRDVARERELSDKEWKLLQDFVRKYSRKEPLRAVTVYRVFDGCVSKDIQYYTKNAPGAELEARGVLLRDLRVRLGLDYVPFGQQIASTREICAGQVLWAAVDGAMSAPWFRMRVSQVHEARFHADVSREDETPPFGPGEKVRFRMWREEDARYVFTSAVVRIQDEPREWVFEHSEGLKRVQARAHYRVRYDQPASVAVLNAPVDDDYSDVAARAPVAMIRARITSLSGGGCALVVEEPLPTRVVLRTHLELPDEPSLEVHARVVSTSPLARGRQLVRAAFVGMPEDTAEAITKYVFHRQQQRAAEDAGEDARP